MDITQAVKLVEKKIDGVDERTKEAVATVTKAYEDGKKEFEAKVVEMNTNLAAKDATIGQIQAEVIELKAKAGKPQATNSGRRISLWQTIHDAIGEHKERFEKVEKSGLIEPIEIKAVGNMTSANLSGDNYQSYLDWRPGMEPTGQFRFRDIVRVINSATDFVQFPRANIPVGEGSFGRQTEGAAKPQVDRDYTMISLTLKPMAGYAIVSRQALRNIIFLQSWLPTSMLEQLQDSEDTDFANSLVAGATGSSTTVGITVAAERLIYLIKNLLTAKYNPNAIVVDPAVWAALMVFRPGTDNPYSLPNVVTLDTNGTVRLLGRPVYPVNWLTGNRVIVGDWSKVAIIQSEGLTMRQSDSHASTFISNETTFLLERTEGLAIFRPDAFITTTLS